MHTENYAYDVNGYLTTVTISGEAARSGHRSPPPYTYLADGTLDKVVSEGGGSAKTTTTYTYEWWDSAKQKEIKVQATGGQPGWAPGFSRFTYDVNGNVKSATDVVGKREFRYLVDGDGQVLRRDEYLGASTNSAGELVSAQGNRSHSYYYLGGHRVGNVGNDGVERVDYAQELAKTTPAQTKAADHYKRFKPSAGVDFDENYVPINSGYPGPYRIRSGDVAFVADSVFRAPNIITNVPGNTLLA